MPIEIEQLPQGSAFTDAPVISEPEVPLLRDVASAAFMRENSVAGIYEATRHHLMRFEGDDNYDVMADIQDSEYEQSHLDSFVGSRSKAETDFIKSKIDAENNRSQIIADGGWTGTVFSMAAGVIDPTIAMPGGAIVKSVKTGKAAVKSAASVGTVAGVSVAAQETILQQAQETRTSEETAYAITGGVLLGGILGAGASKLLSKAEFGKLSDDIADFQDVMVAAEKEHGEFVSNSTAGAAQVDTRQARLKDENVIKKLYGLNYQDPMIRGQLKQSVHARRTTNDLAESPLEMAENADFVPTSVGGSVESSMKTWQGPLAESIENLSDAYSRYYFGTNVGRIKKATAPIRSEFSKGGKLTYTQFKEEVGYSLRRGDKHAIAEVQEAARTFRSKILEPGKQKAIEAGIFDKDIDIRTADSYLTRIYRKEYIIANRGEFKSILEAHFQGERVKINSAIQRMELKGEKISDDMAEFSRLSDEEITDVVDSVIDRILGHPEGRVPYDIVQGNRGPLRERVLNIHDLKIEKFLESDIELIGRQYTRTMSADVELTRKFGDVKLETRLKEVQEDYNRIIETAKDGKSRIKLEKEKAQAVSDIEAIRDRLRGTYALPSNPDGLLVRSGRVLRNLNYLRLLGGMTLSALPDIAKPVFVHGMGRSFQDGLAPIIKNIGAFKMAAKEVKLAGTALDMVLDSRAMAIADIMDDYGRHSKFERSISNLTSKFGIVSLMAPWNAAAKQFSGVIVMTRMLKAMEDLANGKISPDDTRLLASSNLDENLAREIHKQFKAHGKIEDGVYIANTLDWAGPNAAAARDAFRAAVVRDVDRVIVTPGQDKPLWMSTEQGAIIGQFKSFGVASVQKTLLSGVQQRDAATFSGIMMMMSLGAVTYAVKEKSAGREVSADPLVLAGNALDRSGLLGWLADADAMAYKVLGGSPIGTMTRGVGRYRSRNPLGAMLGPSFDALGDAMYVAGSASRGELKESDLHKMRKLAPLQNLFYVRQLLDEVEGKVAEGVGLQ